MRLALSAALAGAVLFGTASIAHAEPKPMSDRHDVRRSRSVAIEAVRGDKGSSASRAAFGEALARQLGRLGFNVVEGGRTVTYRMQPTVLTLDTAGGGAGANVEVKASVVALDRKGRVAAMVEGGARTQNTPGVAPAHLESQAVEAAARSIAEDLARRLLEAH